MNVSPPSSSYWWATLLKRHRPTTHTQLYTITTLLLHTGSFFLSFSSQTSQRVQSVVCCRSEWPLVTLTPLLHHQHPIRLLLLPLQQRNSGGWVCRAEVDYILQSVFSIIGRNIFTHKNNKTKKKQLKSISTWKCVVQSCLISLSSCPSCWLSSHIVQQVNQNKICHLSKKI